MSADVGKLVLLLACEFTFASDVVASTENAVEEVRQLYIQPTHSDDTLKCRTFPDIGLALVK